jgi:hypothetical protein
LKKLNFEDVEKELAKHGCELLNFKNTYTVMEFICSCTRNGTKKYHNFLKKTMCNKCSKELLAETLKRTPKQIKEVFELNDCEILSGINEYKNAKSKITFRCRCGNQHSLTVQDFIAHPRCLECGSKSKADKRRSTIEEINIFVKNNSNCILLSNTYDSHNAKLWFQCQCENKFYTTLHEFKQGNKRQCNDCGALMISGENNARWKGGVCTPNEIARGSPEMKSWRKLVYKRDEYVCQCCLIKKSKRLQAHHILNFSSNFDLRFSIDNGITLCRECHANNITGGFHYIYGVYNNTREQLIEYIINRRKELNITNLELPFVLLYE